MTPERQRIKIAEFCGWQNTPFQDIGSETVDPQGSAQGYCRDGSWHVEVLPDYPNDLNAMHEVEKLLTSAQQCRDYADRLDDGNGGHFATASQRAEALLRTIGKWEETTP